MHRRPALVIASLALGVILGSGTAMAASGGSAHGVAATPRLPACAYLDIKTRFMSLTRWRQTSLDTRLRVGPKYIPTDLVTVGRAGVAGSGKVRRLVIDDLEAMGAAAQRAHKAIAVRSAYRSYDQQVATFAYWVRVSGRAAALRSSARPGHSEHQLGTTIDFRSASSTRAPWDYADWATTGPGRWMKNNAWKYGFVMSYPKGKSSRTCYTYEPWHYRYVGRTLAERIHDSGLTIREYLWRHYESVP
ncbi:MAG: M15 family metallopeptidase [Candidatus Limnocylindrales bacterium]